MLYTGLSRPTCARCALRQQIRHATLLRRPKRPYQFTQLITLSDGSTFLHRTTSPEAVLRSTKDSKNTILWNPSSQKLMNVEEDEAGRLKRFRRRFGRGFDAEAAAENEEGGDAEGNLTGEDHEESLMDLIAGYSQEAEKQNGAAAKSEATGKSGKGKGGQK